MKGAIYTRYSTSNQTKNSTETQVNACMEYCKRNNIEVDFVFSDEETTGTNTQRQQYQNLLKVAENKLIDCVVLYDVTRGSRDVVDWFNFRKEMKALDIQVLSVTEQIGDILNPDNFLTELIHIGIGQHTVLQSRQKSIDAKYTKARHGAFLGGFAPLGYDIVNQQYVINEKEAEVVRKIFELYNQGYTYNEILNDIQKYGVLGKRGRPISKSTLNGLLQNQRYIGRYIWMENINREMHRWVGKKNDNVVVIEDAIPAIIDKETFLKAQERLKGRQYKKSNKAKQDYLLSGLIYCGKCNAQMQGYSTKDSRGHITVSYVCSNKRNSKTCDMKNINTQITNNLVRETIRQWLLSLNLDDIAKKIIQTFKKETTSTNQAEKELQKIQSQIKNLIELMKNGITYPEMKQEMDELQQKKEALVLNIENTKYKNYLAKVNVNRIVDDLKNKILHLDNDTLDNAIKFYVQGVKVNEDHSLDIVVGFRHNNSTNILSKEEKDAIKNIDTNCIDTMSDSGSPGTFRTPLIVGNIIILGVINLQPVCNYSTQSRKHKIKA
ncbi:TPA: recombinase family protein [Candidatus Avigastranaerophilus faecigallinarum]|nr:recombinase family protein [Candidatus Avigastranaerophilus faecigallinarum]